MKLLVTNIQQFCLHDGPGIRTTVFLKGCSLHCPWCCNPENISPKQQYFYKKEKCIASNGRCPYGECPFSERDGEVREKLADITEKEHIACKSGAIGVYGKWYTPENLFNELIKDEIFWGKDGGVTFSGGEPFLQMEALEPLLILLKEKHINICAETSLYVSTNVVKRVVKYFDELYVDVKLLDKKRVRNVLGGNLDIYLKNLDIIFQSKVEVCLRHPQIKEHTDNFETKWEIQKLLTKYPKCNYQVLEEHYLGNEKYYTLGINC